MFWICEERNCEMMLAVRPCRPLARVGARNVHERDALKQHEHGWFRSHRILRLRQASHACPAAVDMGLDFHTKSKVPVGMSRGGGLLEVG